MQAPLRTLSMSPHDTGERRRDSRSLGGTPARLIRAGREPCAAQLTDVSRHGCCAETAADWLQPGRFVAIALPGGDPLECVVRWTSNGFAGLELLRPIGAERFDWLALID